MENSNRKLLSEFSEKKVSTVLSAGSSASNLMLDRLWPKPAPISTAHPAHAQFREEVDWADRRNINCPSGPRPSNLGTAGSKSTLPALIMTDDGGGDWEVLSEVSEVIFYGFK